MDQDETWHGGRPRPRGHTVLDGEQAPPPQKWHSPNFRPMSVVAKWIKMPLGMEIGLSPDDTDGTPFRQKGGTAPPIFGVFLDDSSVFMKLEQG